MNIIYSTDPTVTVTKSTRPVYSWDKTYKTVSKKKSRKSKKVPAKSFTIWDKPMPKAVAVVLSAEEYKANELAKIDAMKEAGRMSKETKIIDTAFKEGFVAKLPRHLQIAHDLREGRNAKKAMKLQTKEV